MSSPLKSIVVWFAVVVAVAACGQQAGKIYDMAFPQPEQQDACGYTWYHMGEPPASLITIQQETNWLKYPRSADGGEGCQVFGIRGCTSFSPDGTVAVIRLRDSPDALSKSSSSCNTELHELLHALKWNHRESHSYTARDFTR